MVDFEACAITEDDFHGVRSLLRQVRPSKCLLTVDEPFFSLLL